MSSSSPPSSFVLGLSLTRVTTTDRENNAFLIIMGQGRGQGSKGDQESQERHADRARVTLIWRNSFLKVSPLKISSLTILLSFKEVVVGRHENSKLLGGSTVTVAHFGEVEKAHAHLLGSGLLCLH
jgi:hypothetical protein